MTITMGTPDMKSSRDGADAQMTSGALNELQCELDGTGREMTTIRKV